MGTSTDSMMQARKDTDICRIDCPHGAIGTIITGSTITYCDGFPVARLTDKVQCNTCGSIFTIITGSSYQYTDALPNARVTDTIEGVCQYGEKCCPHDGITGQIITGSDKTKVAK